MSAQCMHLVQTRPRRLCLLCDDDIAPERYYQLLDTHCTLANVGVERLSLDSQGILVGTQLADPAIAEPLEFGRMQGGLPVIALDGSYEIQVALSSRHEFNSITASRFPEELPELVQPGGYALQIAVPHGVVLGCADLDSMFRVCRKGPKSVLSTRAHVDAMTGV
eukprot:4801218-Amphidinium_carterae.1